MLKEHAKKSLDNHNFVLAINQRTPSFVENVIQKLQQF